MRRKKENLNEMDELPSMGDEVTQFQYDGSRVFAWLADMCGLSVDLVSRKRKEDAVVMYPLHA